MGAKPTDGPTLPSPGQRLESVPAEGSRRPALRERLPAVTIEQPSREKTAALQEQGKFAVDTTRRQFLVSTAGAALAAGSWIEEDSSAAAAAEEAIEIIDTHQHLWDLRRLRLPWLQPGGELTRSFLLSDYLQAARGLKIVKAVYMEVDVEAAQLIEEARYVIELCRRPAGPTVAAVIGARPAEDSFFAYIRRFQDSPYVKGVRRILRNAEQIADPKLAAGLRLLGELGMSFDLCVPPQLLGEGAKLVDRCPGTRFILDHCGNADPLAFKPPGSKLPRAPQHQPEA
jgi:hypothetical protein